ncbi:MAG TPA: hypothetical protein VFT87_02940 [Candidatus Saccharimonadales bacterium]|nr:hypothetical protein [Candidatus Saccharimonadales bacterium]
MNERQERLEPATGIKPGKPYPKYLQKIATESHKLTNLMRLDNEILYIFGNLTLDQWAYTVAYSLGLPSPQNYSYHYFISQLQAKNSDPKLSLFKSRHFKDALWLYYQLRFYRNNFIEHVDRPWQRGSTMSTYGSDFSFFIPTPPGWIPDHVQEQMIESVKHLAPDWVKRLPSDHWQAKPRAVLEAIFKQIDEIPTQAKRDAVWNVWKEIGGSVVSFDALGNRLVNFLDGSTITLFEELAAHPDYTNFGASPYAQDRN